MNKLKFSTVSDGAFIYFLCFFISYGIIKANVLSILTSTALSAIISAVFTLIFIIIISKKEKLKSEGIIHAQLLEAFNKHLYLLSDNDLFLKCQDTAPYHVFTFDIKNSRKIMDGKNDS